MKRITFITLISVLFLTNSYSQSSITSLPEVTTVIPYRLEVGYNTTTVVLFPVSLVPAADRGNREIIVQQEKIVDNVLKIKAAKKDFQPTNLHVYTVDGKIYAFTINYKEYPARTTFDLAKLDESNQETTPLIISNQFINKPHLKQMATQARNARQFFSRKNIRNDMKLQLRTIHTANEWLVFGFRIANLSNLDYDIDFVRMYIRDKQQVKRSSIQEQEIMPVYKNNFKTIAGTEKDQIVIIVPKFTIPDKREFFIEVYEKNGGRHISLRIKNKHLLKAKAFE